MKLKHETTDKKLTSTELGKEFVNRHFSKTATLTDFLSTLEAATIKPH